MKKMVREMNEVVNEFFAPASSVTSSRERYQEALISELLKTLVSTNTISKDEAQAVIRRAKESLK
jgi:hypothetical protein